MHHVHVTIVIQSDLQTVFQAVSDHEWFLNNSDLKCQLIQQGQVQMNGCGAIREVKLSWATFREEMTVFQPPNHFEYRIRSFLNARGEPGSLQHDRGWLDFTPEPTGTRINWHYRFEIPMPIGQNIVELLAGLRTKRAFWRLLRQAKDRLERTQVESIQSQVHQQSSR